MCWSWKLFFLQERLYLSEMAQLESLSTAPRSDPFLLRKQYNLEKFKKE